MSSAFFYKVVNSSNFFAFLSKRVVRTPLLNSLAIKFFANKKREKIFSRPFSVKDGKSYNSQSA